MQRQKCEFIDATSIAFDKRKRVLEVEFHNGTIYQFFDVLPEVVEALLKKASPGTNLLFHLKGKYRFSRI